MQDEPQPISEAALREALEASLGRVAALEREIAAKVEEMKEAKSESDLLRQLLRVRRREDAAEDARVDGEAAAGSHSAPVHPIVREARKELAAAGHPLHISELMDRLQARGVRIPGRGKPANVIAHLSRDADIVRPARGMYGLATWDLPATPTRATRRRVRGQSKTKGGD